MFYLWYKCSSRKFQFFVNAKRTPHQKVLPDEVHQKILPDEDWYKTAGNYQYDVHQTLCLQPIQKFISLQIKLQVQNRWLRMKMLIPECFIPGRRNFSMMLTFGSNLYLFPTAMFVIFGQPGSTREWWWNGEDPTLLRVLLDLLARIPTLCLVGCVLVTITNSFIFSFCIYILFLSYFQDLSSLPQKQIRALKTANLLAQYNFTSLIIIL